MKRGLFLFSSHTPPAMCVGGPGGFWWLLTIWRDSGRGGGNQENTLPHPLKTQAYWLNAPHSVPLSHAPVPEPHWQQGVNGGEQVIEKVLFPPPSNSLSLPPSSVRGHGKRGQRQPMFSVSPETFSLSLSFRSQPDWHPSLSSSCV